MIHGYGIYLAGSAKPADMAYALDTDDTLQQDPPEPTFDMTMDLGDMTPGEEPKPPLETEPAKGEVGCCQMCPSWKKSK